MVKLRYLVKKGRLVSTRQGDFVIRLSKRIVAWISLYCKRIMVVGSIRRKEKNPVDIDIVLIPKSGASKDKIENLLSKKGKRILGGEKKAYFNIEGVEVEIYYTTAEEWGSALLAYSSEFGAGIGLRVVAKRKGLKLSQHGLFQGNKRIAGRTEEEIYHALGRAYKEPWER